MTALRHLMVGLICDSRGVTPYMVELVNWVNAQPGLHGSLEMRESDTEDWGPESPITRVVRKFVVKVEQWRYRRSAQYRPNAPADARHIPAADVERQVRYDVLICIGENGVKAASSLAIDADMLCLGFGPDGKRADAWTAFQEVRAGDAKTRFSIRRIDRSRGHTEVILSGAFPTQTYFVLNQAQLFKRTFGQLRRVLLKLADGGLPVASERSYPSCCAASTAPKGHHWLGYISVVLGRAAAKKAASVLRREERWSVSYIDQPWQEALMANGVEIDNPANRYFADPFIVADGENVFCFVEDYFETRSRGVISVLKLEGRTHRFIGHALEEEFHLSFPFVFEHDGKRYMCPETNEAREIRIYECIQFPLQWTLRSVAMRNVGAVDTMIFLHGQRWWMLTNLDSAGVGEYGSELHLYHADDPLDARWTAHPQNPLRVDPELARNAGMLRDGATLFRVAQARGFGSYGVRSTIFEIEELNVDRYREREVKTLTPNFKPGLSGTHHFHSNAGFSTWDQKRMKALS